jgi:hypothetical protein
MVMNKGKLKRDRKELERLFNMGRHWDFLQGVEAGGLAAMFAQETGKAWRAQVRGAFSSPDGMIAFFRRRREVASSPDLPDLRFLTLAERFLDGDVVAAETAALKNLTPASHSMAKRLLQWADSPADTREIEALFTQFVGNPDQVVGKQMDAAARYFAGHFGEALDFLPDSLETLRKGLLKSSVARKRRGLRFDRLAEMDQEVKDAAAVVPEGILHILMAPLLWRLSRIYEAYCREDNFFALEIAGVTPYLSALLTGERWREVERHLSEDDLTEWYDNDPRSVRKKITAADFPEKVRLLRTLATTLTRAVAENDDFEPFDDDDFDDDVGPGHEDQIRADYLFLYKDVLAEIGRKRSGLAVREQRELTQVMGDILERDFPALYVKPQQCAEFLQAVAQSGLLTTKLALTSLLAARTGNSRPLREAAENALKSLPPPDKGDLVWLFNYFGFLAYPNVTELSPVIRQISGNEPLLNIFVDLIVGRVTRTLLENRMFTSAEFKIFRSHLPDGDRSVRQEMTNFRNALKNFKDIGPFERLMVLAESYPEGYITEAGFRKMLAAQYPTDGVVGLINKLKGVPLPPPNMTGGTPEQLELLGMEFRATLDILKQHPDDLRTAPLDTLTTLIDILERHGTRGVEAGFLIRLSNLLRERDDAGEREVAPLFARVETLIRKAAGKKVKKGRRR